MNGGMTRRFHKLGIRWRRTVSSTLQALNRLRTYLGYPLDTKLVGLQVVSVVALEKRKCSCLCRKYNSTFSVIRSCALHRSIELSGCFYYMNALKTRRKFTLYTHTHTHTHALLKRSWVNILCEIHNDKTGTARKRNRILHNLVNKFDIKFIVSVFIYSFIKFIPVYFELKSLDVERLRKLWLHSCTSWSHSGNHYTFVAVPSVWHNIMAVSKQKPRGLILW